MEKDYICGCGKAYGSYPAFSTHRKLKHNNHNVEGTIIPSQEKARRGRPSYDFKKVPSLDDTNKRYYQGLTAIEFGLLELEEQFKGKIIGSAHSQHHLQLSQKQYAFSKETQQRFKYIAQFTELLTRQMNEEAARKTIQFIEKLVDYGIKMNNLLSMHIYNEFFCVLGKQLSNESLGFSYYVQVCILLSKWLYIIGQTSSTLATKAKSTSVDKKNE